MKTEYELKSIPNTAEYKKTVSEFFVNFFIRGSPLNASVDLIEDEHATQIMGELVSGLLDKGMSFMAVSKTGDMMGVILNDVIRRDENEETYYNDLSAESSKSKKILIFLDKLKRDAKVFDRYLNVDLILKIQFVTVNDTYRTQGVCKILIDKTREFASATGFQMITVDCTSHFSAKAVKRSGFQSVHSIAYTDYVNEHGEIVFKMHFPHTHAHVYVLPLQ